MIKNQYIQIKSKSINGLIHAQFVLEGKIINKNYNSIEVKADDKIIDSNLRTIGTRGKFILNANLKKENHQITVLIKDDITTYTICKINNNIINRIKYRIKKNINKIGNFFGKFGHGIAFLWKEHHFLIPPALWGKYLKSIILKIKHLFVKDYYYPFNLKQYNKWIEKNEEQTIYKDLKYKPLISILIPVFNINREYLSACLDSILAQKYENFEVCLADDCSTLTETKETLKEYERRDKRIKVVYRSENGHISKATNSALEIAKGEFIGLMDNDDVLTENALYEMVLALNENKELDLIYSDEDKLDMKGRRCEPHFKPDFSPESLLGGNYICHFEIIRASIMKKIGGFRSEYVGAQDFDLFLRIVDESSPKRIHHIKKILYHWRKVPGSTADTIENKDYAIQNGRKAVEDCMKRRNLAAKVTVPIKSTHYIVEYLYEQEPKVSIIIPTKDLATLLERCLQSIYNNTNYKNYEIIIIDNNSEEEETKKLFKKYSKNKNLRIIKYKGEFNFAKINNEAVKYANGTYLMFLNNDTEVISKNWLKIMVGYAMQNHIGAVGAKLLYENDTIQHGGVILGINGVARHAFLNYDADTYGFYGRMLVPYNYSAVTAACLMVSKKKFEEVNGLTEELKVAYNDIDFNLKLLEKGYYNVFLPQIELYHYESKSRGLDTTTEKYNQFKKEERYMFNKWSKYIKDDPFYNKNFSKLECFMLDKKRSKIWKK